MIWYIQNAGVLISHFESKWISEYYYTMKSLRLNKSVVITKPDKGSGVVILDFQYYVNKML